MDQKVEENIPLFFPTGLAEPQAECPVPVGPPRSLGPPAPRHTPPSQQPGAPHTPAIQVDNSSAMQLKAEQAAEKEAKRLARPSTRRPQKVASKAAEHSAPPPTRRSRKGTPPRAPVGSLLYDSEPRCAQCGLSRTAFPATCVQCVSNKARRAHDKVDGEPAASCQKGRCPPQCPGRNSGV